MYQSNLLAAKLYYNKCKSKKVDNIQMEQQNLFEKPKKASRKFGLMISEESDQTIIEKP